MRPRFLLLVALVALGLLVQVPVTVRAEEEAQSSHIVVLGDSIAAGPRAFPALLSRRLGVPVVNSSIPGDTTYEGLERLNRLLAGSPRLVIVELGANDLETHESRRATARNLSYIFGRVRAAGAAVMFLDVRPPGMADANDVWRPVCQARGVFYVHDILEGLDGRTELNPDHEHPTAAGHEALARRLAPLVRGVLAASDTDGATTLGL